MNNVNFSYTSKKFKKILDLAKRLDLSASEILKISKISDDQKYETDEIEKADGRIRKIHKPCADIRKIQRRINKRVFNAVVWPTYIYGSVPTNKLNTGNKDYVECAAMHCQARSILKLDIEDYFDNISEDLVYRIFKNFFGFSEKVSDVLTKVCTVDGALPQGGLTSSYLASLVLFEIETNIYLRLKNKKLVYTRYVDDITISSRKDNFNFQSIVNILEVSLNSIDLPLNQSKVKVSNFSSELLRVHNIRVDQKKPILDKDEVAKIKNNISRLKEIYGDKYQPNVRTYYFYREDFNRCVGLINKLGRVNHPSYEKLNKILLRIQPLPNLSDIKYVRESIDKLKNNYPSHMNSYMYRKLFFRIQYRIAFIKRHKIYEKTAIKLNNELQKYRASYEK